MGNLEEIQKNSIDSEKFNLLIEPGRNGNYEQPNCKHWNWSCGKSNFTENKGPGPDAFTGEF